MHYEVFYPSLHCLSNLEVSRIHRVNHVITFFRGELVPHIVDKSMIMHRLLYMHKNCW